MAVLYRHIRLDKDEPFYIGIGKDESRAYSKRNRTKYWHNITNKGPFSEEHKQKLSEARIKYLNKQK